MGENDDRNTFRVVRSADMAVPREQVFERLIDFHRWVDWSPWEGLDPDLQRNYSGPDGVGAVYEWEGNRKAGKGRMEILEADAPSDLRIQLDFLKPFKSHNRIRFTLRPEGDGGTHVEWAMTGPKTFMSRVMGIFMNMDKMVGGDFEKGLVQLKAEVEG